MSAQGAQVIEAIIFRVSDIESKILYVAKCNRIDGFRSEVLYMWLLKMLCHRDDTDIQLSRCSLYSFQIHMTGYFNISKAP